MQNFGSKDVIQGSHDSVNRVAIIPKVEFGETIFSKFQDSHTLELTSEAPILRLSVTIQLLIKNLLFVMICYSTLT